MLSFRTSNEADILAQIRDEFVLERRCYNEQRQHVHRLTSETLNASAIHVSNNIVAFRTVRNEILRAHPTALWIRFVPFNSLRGIIQVFFDDDVVKSFSNEWQRASQMEDRVERTYGMMMAMWRRCSDAIVVGGLGGAIGDAISMVLSDHIENVCQRVASNITFGTFLSGAFIGLIVTIAFDFIVYYWKNYRDMDSPASVANVLKTFLTTLGSGISAAIPVGVVPFVPHVLVIILFGLVVGYLIQYVTSCVRESDVTWKDVSSALLQVIGWNPAPVAPSVWHFDNFNIPIDLECPITLHLPVEPVFLRGSLFERDAITQAIIVTGRNPLTNMPAQLEEIKQNANVRRLIYEYARLHGGNLQ